MKETNKTPSVSDEHKSASELIQNETRSEIIQASKDSSFEEQRHDVIASSFNLDQLISHLPLTIRQCVDLLDNYEERKIATFAVITLAGSLMPNVEINYDGSINHPQLMLLISYPPASGKGKLTHLLELINSIDEDVKEQSMQVARKYNTEYNFYKVNIKKGIRMEEPIKPNQKLYIIPGNTTSSKLMQQLAENGESQVGLIFETETDALANMLGSTHGIDNSMMLRKVFHHEYTSQMRKTNNEHLVASKPKLAIIVSGTPSQIPKLFSSNSDGLFSRFTIVSGTSPIIWKDVKPKVGIPLSLQFKDLSHNFYSMWQHHASHKLLEIDFSDSQWDIINIQGKYLQSISLEEGGENAVSIARRHMNMMARIASILTAVRHYENKSISLKLECNMTDFNLAMVLSEISFYQALELFKALPGEVIKPAKKALEFYNKIPDTVFATYQISEIIAEMDVDIRTIQRYIKQLRGMELLIEVSRNRYKKVKKQE